MDWRYCFRITIPYDTSVPVHDPRFVYNYVVFYFMLYFSFFHVIHVTWCFFSHILFFVFFHGLHFVLFYFYLIFMLYSPSCVLRLFLVFVLHFYFFFIFLFAAEFVVGVGSHSARCGAPGEDVRARAGLSSLGNRRANSGECFSPPWSLSMHPVV